MSSAARINQTQTATARVASIGLAALMAAASASRGVANAQTPLLSEDFEQPFGFLPPGWVSVNNSFAPGQEPNWITQSGPNLFNAYSGNTYVRASYYAAAGRSDIRLYLMSPVISITSGDTLSFWTRTVTESVFPDRLRVVLSTAGSSTNPTDFQTTLLTINPNLTSGYPFDWTEFRITIPTLNAQTSGGPLSGRFAFFYDVPNGGPQGENANFVGVDNVTYTTIPGPGAAGALALAGGYWATRRRRAR